MSKSRKSAKAEPFGDVGPARHDIYREARDRVQGALANGYWLEAITLIESLLSDRLESRASYLAGENKGFQNLGPLLNDLRDLERVPAFRELEQDIDEWRVARNSAIHELPKLEDGKLGTWAPRLAALQPVAIRGCGLLYRWAKLDEAERAGKPNVRPPASYPNLFAGWGPEGFGAAEPAPAADDAPRRR